MALPLQAVADILKRAARPAVRLEIILVQPSLESELRALDPNLSKLVVDLRVTGAVSLSGRKRFEEKILQSFSAAVRGLRFDEVGLVLNPTDQDLDEIDHAGFVRVAADRLKAVAADMSNQGQAGLAALALKRLYLEHLRQGARS